MRHVSSLPGSNLAGIILGACALAFAGIAADAAQVARPAESEPFRLVLSSEFRIRVVDGREPVLEVRAAENDDFARIAHRLCGGANRGPDLAIANPQFSSADFERDPWISVPIGLLNKELRGLLLRSLFPEDTRGPDGDWIHVARSGKLPVFDAGLWQVAEWFTGDGSNFTELMEQNGLTSPELRPGQKIHIPRDLLHPAFAPLQVGDSGDLEFDRDGDGPYAAYRLRAGEALYSAVIVRFTGRTKGEDVVKVAEHLRQRSGVRDLHDIPVGYLVKIPFDLLEPEFLPQGHPRRREAEERRAELEAELAREPVQSGGSGLKRVLVVIDPGHGGKDIGTRHNGVWEHDYVYDIACRLKQRLERETAAEVRMTLIDSETGCEPAPTDTLRQNFQGSVLTTPPFLSTKVGEADTSANLRWYLANSIYRKALKDGYDADRVIFISIHADARHASLRGLMVYIPGANYRTRTYGKNGKPYMDFAEVREQPFVKFSKKSRLRSEAISKQFAEELVRSFESHGLPVQKFQPVRNRIIRGKSRFVPAVVRSNEIPTKVLAEVLNLQNSEDAGLLGSAAARQRMADSLLFGIFSHFGETPPS